MKRLLAAIVAAGFAAPVLAQAPDFASLDIDQSGTISLPELQAVLPSLTEESFYAADTDGSGELSPEEFAVLTGE